MRAVAIIDVGIEAVRGRRPPASVWPRQEQVKQADVYPDSALRARPGPAPTRQELPLTGLSGTPHTGVPESPAVDSGGGSVAR